MNNIHFFDFDGTLFSHNTKNVSQAVQAALGRLYCNGDTIVIASGRGRESEQFIRKSLDIDPHYLILMNGQVILESGKLVYENYADVSKMCAIMDFAEANGYAYGGYCKDGILVNQLTSRVKTVWKEFGSDLPIEYPHFQQYLPLYQGHLYATEDEARTDFVDYLSDYVVNWSHPYLLNLIPKEAGKSQAIEWCLNKLGTTKQYAYAYGDGFNDYDMLQAVAHGVAMGNASDNLKSAAEFITDTVDNDGVAVALNHYHLI